MKYIFSVQGPEIRANTSWYAGSAGTGKNVTHIGDIFSPDSLFCRYQEIIAGRPVKPV